MLPRIPALLAGIRSANSIRSRQDPFRKAYGADITRDSPIRREFVSSTGVFPASAHESFGAWPDLVPAVAIARYWGHDDSST
jgi:hypothetical protein